MTTRNLRQQKIWLIVAGVFVLLFSLLFVSPVTARPPRAGNREILPDLSWRQNFEHDPSQR